METAPSLALFQATLERCSISSPLTSPKSMVGGEIFGWVLGGFLVGEREGIFGVFFLLKKFSGFNFLVKGIFGIIFVN